MYGTLINGYLKPAPKKVRYGERNIWNPEGYIYEELCYFLVVYTDMPEDAPEGFHYESAWEQGEKSINQIWNLVEDDHNIPDEDAFAIIMGEMS